MRRKIKETNDAGFHLGVKMIYVVTVNIWLKFYDEISRSSVKIYLRITISLHRLLLMKIYVKFYTSMFLQSKNSIRTNYVSEFHLIGLKILTTNECIDAKNKYFNNFKPTSYLN